MIIVQILTRSDLIGGAQVHVKNLSIELQRSGHIVHLLIGGQGIFINEIKAHNLHVQSIPRLIRSINPYLDWRAFWDIRNALKKIKPDLIATHSSKAGWLGRLAAYSLNIPAIFTAHGWAFTEGVPLIKRLIYILAERVIGLVSNKIITVSEYDAALCLKYTIVPNYKVVTIYNGIPYLPKQATIDHSSTPRLVMTARFEKPKNHIILLKALATLTDYNWHLDFIGEGPLKTEVIYWISKLNLTTRVSLLGERKDVSNILEKAQIFVLISDWEGLPISILEAMRAGLPVIASAVGGIPEMIDDDINGFLIPKGNISLLRKRLLTLITNKDIRNRMGMASHTKFAEHFTIDLMIKKTLNVYRLTIKEK